MKVIKNTEVRRKPQVERAWAVPHIAGQIPEACRPASLKIGGPKLRGLGVTSALPGEGRTTIALAMALIQHLDYGRSALLLEMDLENPTLARRLGADPWPGLSELVRGENSLNQVVQPVADGLSFIAAGVTSGSAARILSDFVQQDLLEQVSREADVVVADLPSLLGCSFGRGAAAVFGDLLLVVRAGITPVARVREATTSLPVQPSVLLNGTHSSLPQWLHRLIGH
jgi:Mrp family chromosome partitioning ATPase